jgi:hypothetical protein
MWERDYRRVFGSAGFNLEFMNASKPTRKDVICEPWEWPKYEAEKKSHSMADVTSAEGHRFNPELVCSGCGVTWARNKSRPQPCRDDGGKQRKTSARLKNAWFERKRRRQRRQWEIDTGRKWVEVLEGNVPTVLSTEDEYF